MALSGDLGEFHLHELLQILSLGKKTGVISIQGDVAQGTLGLVAGRLLDARAEGLAGEAAFFLLLRNRRGPFIFASGDPAAPNEERTIHRSLQELLIDASVAAPDPESGGERS